MTDLMLTPSEVDELETMQDAATRMRLRLVELHSAMRRPEGNDTTFLASRRLDACISALDAFDVLLIDALDEIAPAKERRAA